MLLSGMTELLDRAVQIARNLPHAEQDSIARLVLQLAVDQELSAVPLSLAERDAIANSKAAAERGEIATQEQIRLSWAKHNL